jgi:hypothetical protein
LGGIPKTQGAVHPPEVTLSKPKPNRASPPITTVVVASDTEATVERALSFIDNEVSKALARSLSTSSRHTSSEDVANIAKMLRSLTEVKAERRASAISARDATLLSDEELAQEIMKLAQRRGKQ